ncbi:Molybdopterin biosynthesis protein MoeA [Rhodopirellula islandica]|uniref:Molybdopterin molybdenumtransferase n=1 Tax=Rhodopirellula islandica TaxID=595434 RepID=A0A0J1B3U1_RHOIS|nr:molybdopterin molybdotransferase MoeA [Rhodopirellula islandica]KLU01422.1 Molybdopterin biosynthesis protein MoeA [Rhodopirellula islandica]
MNAASPFAFDSPDQAIQALSQRITATDIESVDFGSSLASLQSIHRRILAEPILADRDSPAANVSAMDGYAIYESDLKRDGVIEVTGESVPGSPPPSRSDSGVIRIFTGAIVPEGCDRVIQREHTEELAGTSADDSNSRGPNSRGQIRWTERARSIPPGANIRCQGENLTAGSVAIPAGLELTSPRLAALTNFGVHQLQVHRPVRVAVLTTGDELASASSKNETPLPPWKIRNSNASALIGLLANQPWIDCVSPMHAVDKPSVLRASVLQAIEHHDVVLMTGGVSMGDYDYVPRILQEVGAEIVFHKLPLRPGKPILGAIQSSPTGATLILGLPGNPVSATMGARRFAMPLIRKFAGLRDWAECPPHVMLDEVGDKTLPLHWMRGVRMIQPGVAELVLGKGSGDLATLALTDGFIEMPPHANAPGPWPYFAW